MTKQELIERINWHIRYVQKEPFDSKEETNGFINAMGIALSFAEHLDETTNYCPGCGRKVEKE